MSILCLHIQLVILGLAPQVFKDKDAHIISETTPAPFLGRELLLPVFSLKFVPNGTRSGMTVCFENAILILL